MTGSGERRLWESDANERSGKTSMAVLLDWLTQHGNYERWRGGSMTGETKATIIQEIVRLLHDNGLFHRHERDVRSKINDLERSFRDAVDWRNKTGAGVLEEGGDISAELKKRCKYYDLLVPIMLDRPSSQPLCTNEDSSLDGAATDFTAEVRGAMGIGRSGDTQVAATDGVRSPRATSDPGLQPSSSTADAQHATNTVTAQQTTTNKPKTTTKRKGGTVMDVWKEVSTSNLSVERERLALETKRLKIEEEKAQLDNRLRQIQVLKELALARKALVDAGVDRDEIENLLPLP